MVKPSDMTWYQLAIYEDIPLSRWDLGRAVSVQTRRTRSCVTWVTGSRAVVPQKTQSFAVSAVVTLGLLGAMACFGCGGERDQRTTSTTDSNEVTTDSNKNKVVADAVDQYHIANRSGTPIDQCVRARVVTAAYLQAKDEDNYKIWKETEATDCGAVGMPPQ